MGFRSFRTEAVIVVGITHIKGKQRDSEKVPTP
jgi:hypothetical protein